MRDVIRVAILALGIALTGCTSQPKPPAPQPPAHRVPQEYKKPSDALAELDRVVHGDPETEFSVQRLWVDYEKAKRTESSLERELAAGTAAPADSERLKKQLYLANERRHQLERFLYAEGANPKGGKR